MAREYIEFEDVRLIRSTEMAGLYEIDGSEVWIPFSQIDGGSVDKDGETGSIYVTEWFCAKEGLG